VRLKNDIWVISGTHWDREWQFPFEKTRMLLVEMMDRVLDLLDRNPDGARFHLDGQTIPVADYLEVRPENRQRLCRHVREGRLLIGPWLVLPAENQVSGESLVRNLLWGERHGREYGGCMKVGYSPTSWGQVSQMPQIFREAGIDSIIFYRGLALDRIPGHYYLWEGPDGSRLLGVRLGALVRYGFHFCVIRPVLFGREPNDRTYDWRAGGKPLRICGKDPSAPYIFCLPPVGWHPERLAKAFEDLEEMDLGRWEMNRAPAFACDDSTGPIPATDRIIAEANRLVDNDRRVTHATLPDFLAAARAELDETRLPVLTGEMRHPRRGPGKDLFAEIQACRIPTKYANRRAEFALQRVAEPLCALAWTLGEEYPQFHLDRANLLLLSNHAHDSIGGCARDSVDEDVRNRLRQVRVIADALAEKAVCDIVRRVDTRGREGDIALVVFNTLPRARSAVVRGEIDIPRDRRVGRLRVLDPDGREAPVQRVAKSEEVATFWHPQETPCNMESSRWEFYFRAADVPAMGYRVFHVVADEEEARGAGSVLVGRNAMENEHLRVTVNRDGTANVTLKESNWTLRNQNSFQDRGEVGDYWVGRFPERDRMVSSLGGTARVSVVEHGPLSAAIEAVVSMDLPVRATDDGSARERETRPVQIRSRYRLLKGERFLRIETTVENTVEDHILRALFPTGIATDAANAEVPFDVVERPIPLPDDRDGGEPYRPVQPHRNFVDLNDGDRGVAVLNRGLPQYEAVDDPDRTVALTLLRCHRAWNSIRGVRYRGQRGTQLPGTHRFEYALMPHRGDWAAAGVVHEAERFNVEPLVAAVGPGEGDLPPACSFLRLEGDGVVLHALKRGEWDESLVVRLSNPTGAHVDARLTLSRPFARAQAVNLLENEVKGDLKTHGPSVIVPLPPKKIATVRITLGR